MDQQQEGKPALDPRGFEPRQDPIPAAKRRRKGDRPNGVAGVYGGGEATSRVSIGKFGIACRSLATATAVVFTVYLQQLHREVGSGGHLYAVKN